MFTRRGLDSFAFDPFAFGGFVSGPLRCDAFAFGGFVIRARETRVRRCRVSRVGGRGKPEVSFRGSGRAAIGGGQLLEFGLAEAARAHHFLLESARAEQMRDPGVESGRVKGGLDLGSICVAASAEAGQGGVDRHPECVSMGDGRSADLVA